MCWSQSGIKLETKHVIYESSQFLCRKGISMLTGLKASSLASKCVPYKPEHIAKGRPNGIEF